VNRGDEKALRRAAAKLNIPSNETLLEFDIGDFLFLILPKDFPAPLPLKAKRIDLVASDRALYVHCFGIHRRYGWSEILECSFSDEFFHWRQRTGPKCQVHMIRGFRPLAQVISECLKDYELHLDPTESQGRAMQRVSYDAQDQQRKARSEILDKQNRYSRALEFEGTVCNAAGEILVSSVVGLETQGVEFIFDKARQRLLIPYESIRTPEINVIQNSLSAIILDQNYQSFTVQGKKPDTITHWKTDLDQLIAIELE
jgi:hypothetical protein